jgi:hypothetical protein
MWVVYDRPRDFPNVVILCRVWYGEFATTQIMTAESLAEMRRKLIEAGACANIGRFPDDDPCIVECWV